MAALGSLAHEHQGAGGIGIDAAPDGMAEGEAAECLQIAPVGSGLEAGGHALEQGAGAGLVFLHPGPHLVCDAGHIPGFGKGGVFQLREVFHDDLAPVREVFCKHGAMATPVGALVFQEGAGVGIPDGGLEHDQCLAQCDERPLVPGLGELFQGVKGRGIAIPGLEFQAGGLAFGLGRGQLGQVFLGGGTGGGRLEGCGCGRTGAAEPGQKERGQPGGSHDGQQDAPDTEADPFEGNTRRRGRQRGRRRRNWGKGIAHGVGRKSP